MVGLLHESLDAGALGFSSSLGEAHTDGDGEPRAVTRRRARRVPRARAAAVRQHAGTTLEFIAAMGEIPEARAELMADMSLAADRPLNWNLLGSLSPTAVYEQQLTSCDLAAAKGATVVALALPDLLRMRSERHPPVTPRMGRRARAPRARTAGARCRTTRPGHDSGPASTPPASGVSVR